MNKIEIIILEIKKLIKANSLDKEIEFNESKSGYFIWLRRIDKIRRHIWVRELEITNETKYDYGIVWGEYPAWEDYPNGIDGFRGFDSRSFGNLKFTLEFYKAWIIENRKWEEMPRVEIY